MSHHKIHDRKVLYPGDTLIREGDAGDVAYFVESGTLGVYKVAGDEEVQLAVLEMNSIVGEMELIDNSRRNASVRCINTATVVLIDRPTFERKIHRLDRFTRALLETFVSRLQSANSSHAQLRQITANNKAVSSDTPVEQVCTEESMSQLDIAWNVSSIEDKCRMINSVSADDRQRLIGLLGTGWRR